MSVSYEVPEKSGRGSPGINKEIYPFLCFCQTVTGLNG